MCKMCNKLLLIALLALLIHQAGTSSPDITNNNFIKDTKSNFIENKGQIRLADGTESTDKIKYYAKYSNSIFYLLDDRLSLVTVSDSILERTDLIFKGCNKKVIITGEKKKQEYYNYYLSSLELEDVQSFSQVKYKNLYKNIDLIIYSKDDRIKYDFVIHPGANVKDIKLKYSDNVTKMTNSDNLIEISTALNIIKDRIPEAYLIKNETRIPLNAKYCLSNGQIAFNVPKYDKNKTLIIDPEILWSTYLGGSLLDMTFRAKFDRDNNIVVTGNTISLDFPSTPGVYSTKNFGDQDMFVSKFAADGKLIWSTYVGGSGRDHSNMIGFSPSNSIWCGGETASYDFPVTPSAFQSGNQGGYADASIVRVSKDGKLEYATYQGGPGYEAICDGDCDANGNFWCVGGTFSSSITTTSNAIKRIQTTSGMDAMIMEIGDDLQLKYSSLFGGNNDDTFYSIALSKTGEPVCNGNTSSYDYPLTKDAIQKNKNGGYDVVITKFDTYGQVIWSTLYGGSQNDFGGSITTDKNNNVIATGFTLSDDFKVTTDAFQAKLAGDVDRYLIKLTENGALLWSTFIGGKNAEGYDSRDCQYGNVKCDKDDNIYLTGFTKSLDFFTTTDAYQKKLFMLQDAFFTQFSPDGSVVYSTYFGGRGNDLGISIDAKNDKIILSGFTESIDFPVTQNAYQKQFKSVVDVFLVMFGLPSPCVNNPFEYENFINFKNIKFGGITHKADSSIMLTDTRQYVVGTASFDGLIPVDKGFSTRFSFRFSYGNNYNCQDGSLPGADGIAFLIQNAGTNAIGYPGGGLGYENIPNSLAIEYDTFSNDSTQIENYFDPNGNHVAVQSMKGNANTPKHNKTANIAMNSNIFPIVSNGRIYYSQIDYSAEKKTLSVYLDTNKTLTNRVLFLQNFDLASYVSLNGGTKAVMGFTSATGCATQMHEIMSWDICLESSEPATDVISNENTISEDIFPNPADKYFFLPEELLNNSLNITVYNSMTPKVTKEFNFETLKMNKFDISDLSNGIYFVLIRTNTKSIVKKLVILR